MESHFRARLRLCQRWHGIPSRTYTSFKFFDESGEFRDIHKLAHYVYLKRSRRRTTHGWAREQFLNDIVRLLKLRTITVQVRRVRISDGRGVELVELTHEKAAVLIVLRNWVNPLFESELARAAEALETHARTIRHDFRFVWKCVIASGFEKGQTRLDRFSGIKLYELPYVVPKWLVNHLAAESGIDYSYAFPSRERWPTGLTDTVREVFTELLTAQATPVLDRRFGFACKPTRAAASTHISLDFNSPSKRASSLLTPPTYIDSIAEAPSLPIEIGGCPGPPVYAKLSPRHDTQDICNNSLVKERSPCSDAVSAGAEYETEPLVSGEQLRVARTIGNRYGRIDFLKCLTASDPRLRDQPWRVVVLAMRVWGLEKRTARGYVEIVMQLLQLAKVPLLKYNFEFEEATRTRYARINYLTELLENNPCLCGEPRKLVVYAMLLWHIRESTALEYVRTAVMKVRHETLTDTVHAAWTKKRQLRNLVLFRMASRDKSLAQDTRGLVEKAMMCWHVQERTARKNVKLVKSMLQSTEGRIQNE